MIALAIRYLSGYAAATDLARQRAEWPVHPGRVFLAMAAAHYETGADPEERLALEWLESRNPPSMTAGPGHPRRIEKTYVPVNDAPVEDAPAGVLTRSRQERTFPKVWLEDDTVYLQWQDEAPETVRAALARLCPNVTRIGHSASLVQMWVAENEIPNPNWLPDESSTLRLRVPNTGAMLSFDEAFNAAGFAKLDELSDQLEKAKGKSAKELKQQLKDLFPDGSPLWRRPILPKWQGYVNTADSPQAKPSAAIVSGPFDNEILILSKYEGRALGLESTLELTGALRNAALKAADRAGIGQPEWLTGHTPDGSPSTATHTAFFPLPFVGREHADGHVMGLAIALPRHSSAETPEDYRKILSALLFDPETAAERSIRIWKNPVWEWELRRETNPSPPSALTSDSWTRPSKSWASVTPIVLHHYPKKNRPADIERIVREAFVSAQFPEPESIKVRSISVFEGAGHEREMPPYNEGGPGLCRYQTHLIANFSDHVSGPMLVGRGRFRGYGLFRPYSGGRP